MCLCVCMGEHLTAPQLPVALNFDQPAGQLAAIFELDNVCLVMKTCWNMTTEQRTRKYVCVCVCVRWERWGFAGLPSVTNACNVRNALRLYET